MQATTTYIMLQVLWNSKNDSNNEPVMVFFLWSMYYNFFIN